MRGIGRSYYYPGKARSILNRLTTRLVRSFVSSKPRIGCFCGNAWNISAKNFVSDFGFRFDILVKMSETDLQLLIRYSSRRAEDAFTEVVRRYADLVHSAALRQVRSPELAEEVAQSVFIELARQAHQLPPRTVLAAWLYAVTRRRAIDAVRREAGRRLREQTVQQLQIMNATAEDWTQIEPLLDDAMHALQETERLAVLLRYFQNKPLREVGQVLGVSDDAAQKRVSRAVERLREFFVKRGITMAASGLVLVISANSIQAAPVGLTVTISAAVALTGGAITTTAMAGATNAMAMTALQKSVLLAALLTAAAAATHDLLQTFRTRELRQQQRQQQNKALEERDEAARQASVFRDENDRLNRDSAELAKLRGEVVALRRDAKRAASLEAELNKRQGGADGQIPPGASSS